MATAAELQTKLAEIDAAISGVLANGQSYNVTNSHGVTGANLDQLYKQKSLLEKRILRLCGYTGRNHAYFC